MRPREEPTPIRPVSAREAARQAAERRHPRPMKASRVSNPDPPPPLMLTLPPPLPSSGAVSKRRGGNRLVKKERDVMRLEKYLKREQCGNPMTVENHETVERALGRNLVRLERKAKAMRSAQLNRRDRIDALPTGSPLDGLYPKKRMKFNTITKKPLILTEMPKPEIPDVSPAAIFRESELAEEEEEDPPRPISRPEPIVAAMPPLPVLPPILGEAATMQISSQAVDAQPNSLPPQVVDARPKSLQSQVADASPISPPTQVVDAQPISPPTQVVDAQPISLPTQVVDAPPILLPL